MLSREHVIHRSAGEERKAHVGRRGMLAALDPPAAGASGAGPRPAGGARRVVGGVTLILVGFSIIAFYSVGALFVAGAAQRHDPSVTWGAVAIRVGSVLGAVALCVAGTATVIRRDIRVPHSPDRA